MNALELLRSGEGSDFTIITADGPRHVHLSHIRGAGMFGGVYRSAAAAREKEQMRKRDEHPCGVNPKGHLTYTIPIDGDVTRETVIQIPRGAATLIDFDSTTRVVWPPAVDLSDFPTRAVEWLLFLLYTGYPPDSLCERRINGTGVEFTGISTAAIIEIEWHIIIDVDLFCEIMRLVDFVSPTEELRTLIENIQIDIRSGWSFPDILRARAVHENAVITLLRVYWSTITVDKMRADLADITTETLIDIVLSVDICENRHTIRQFITVLETRDDLTFDQFRQFIVEAWGVLGSRDHEILLRIYKKHGWEDDVIHAILSK